MHHCFCPLRPDFSSRILAHALLCFLSSTHCLHACVCMHRMNLLCFFFLFFHPFLQLLSSRCDFQTKKKSPHTIIFFLRLLGSQLSCLPCAFVPGQETLYNRAFCLDCFTEYTTSSDFLPLIVSLQYVTTVAGGVGAYSKSPCKCGHQYSCSLFLFCFRPTPLKEHELLDCSAAALFIIAHPPIQPAFSLFASAHRVISLDPPTEQGSDRSSLCSGENGAQSYAWAGRS